MDWWKGVCDRKRLGFGIALAAVLVSQQKANAGDYIFTLMSPAYKDSIVIGEVVSKSEDRLVFNTGRVVQGDRVPKTITVSGYTLKQVKTLVDGDFAVLSLNKTDRRKQYELVWDAVEVDSLKPDEAKIIEGTLTGSDRIVYNWFLNTCGSERGFTFDYSGDGDVISVRRESGLQDIVQSPTKYPNHEWEMVAEPPACKPAAINWWRSMLRRLNKIVSMF